MRIIEELKKKAIEAYQRAQESTNAAEKVRWMQEYQRLYRALKTQEAIVFG